jgi:hypothetical protein
MTQTELNKLHKSIATDFKIAARKTDLWTIEYCYEILHDVKKYMVFGYAETISLIMHDANGLPLKAKKYRLGTTDRVHNDRPGGIDWEDGEGHGLSVVIMYSKEYINLPEDRRYSFQTENLKSIWSPSSTNVEFPHLSQELSRMYTHESAGVDRVDFN